MQNKDENIIIQQQGLQLQKIQIVLTVLFGLIASLPFLLPKIKIFASLLNKLSSQLELPTLTIQLLTVLILFVILTLFLSLFSIIKKQNPLISDDVSPTNKQTSNVKLKKHDIELIQEIKNLLPSSGVMKFVKDTDFAGSFIQNKLDPLYHFTENCTNAEHEFLDKELEKVRIDLFEKNNEFLRNIALKTAPLEHNPNLQTVSPRNFDHSEEMRKKVNAEIKAIHNSADELYKSHQEFIRLSNSKNT